MKSLTTINGKPVETPEQDAADLRNMGIDAKATPRRIEVEVPSLTHKPECGDVGETGDHGEIGDNAA